MAEAVGVTPQTINKWAMGQTMPEPDRWPAVEAFLELDDGAIAAAFGVTRPGPGSDAADESLDELRALIAQLGDDVSSLRAEVAELRLERRQHPPEPGAPARSSPGSARSAPPHS